MPYHIIPCHAAIPYHTVPYFIIPCHVAPTIRYHTADAGDGHDGGYMHWLGQRTGFTRAGITLTALHIRALKVLHCWVYDGTYTVGYLPPATYSTDYPLPSTIYSLSSTLYPLPSTLYPLHVEYLPVLFTNSLCCSQTVTPAGAPRRTELEEALQFVDGFGSRVSPGNVPARECSTHTPPHP